MTHLPHPEVWRPGPVVERPLDALLPSPANARTHGAVQLRKLVRSIRAFGFTSPVLVDAADRIVAGHGRVAAARDLGMATVPTVRLDHLTPAQCRALALADNRIAELAGWDRDLLRIELGALPELDASLDLTLTGFEVAGADVVLHSVEDAELEPDLGLAPAPDPTISRPGDRWTMGGHALLCGDPAAPGAWAALPGAEPAAMLFAALPPIAPPEITPALRAVLAAAVAASRPGALHYLCVDWRALDALAAATPGLYAGQADLCVWDRGVPGGNADSNPDGFGSPYRPQHGLVAVWRTGDGDGDRQPRRWPRRMRTNLWRYPVDAAAAHPDGRGPPVAMIADAILDATRAGAVVLDPFGGCGATLLAAERTGRRARLVEADPRRADAAVRRWQAATGGTATLARSGASRGASPGAGQGGDPGEAFETVARRRCQETTDA